MELNACEVPPKQSRKKLREPSKWKRTLKKIERYSPKQPPKLVCGHNTKAYECKSLSQRDIQNFHDTFYAKKCKAYQDAFILKFCVTSPIQRRRATKCNRAPKMFQVKCFARKINTKRLVAVCQKTFLAVLGITRARLNYVTKIFHEQGKLPIEKRGGNHRSHKYVLKQSAVISFLNSLKCVESHYCRAQTQRHYLPSELTINKLYKIYNESCPHELKVKKSYFRSIFNSKFNLGFKVPRVDVCSTCTELSEKMKSCDNENLKQTYIAQKRIHTLKYQEFYKFLKDESPEILILSFDCQKNQVLPKVSDQVAYYSRQLYFQNFTIVQGPSTTKLNRNNVFIYTWTENQFSKNANLISSAVYHRLRNTHFNDNISILRLVADGCGGQNRNSIMVGMLLKWFLHAPASLKKIELIFPIVGHSFLPPDRVFGNAEKRIKKMETILFPEEYEKVLGEFGTVMKVIDQCPVYDWKDTNKDILLPPGKWQFKFSTTKMFFFRKTNQGKIVITGEENYRTHLNQRNYHSICKKNCNVTMIQPSLIQPYSVNINSLKVRDVNNLMNKHFGENWQNDENLKFYANFVNNSQIIEEDTPQEVYCNEPIEEAPVIHI